MVVLRLLLALGALVALTHACTSMMAGPEATADGTIWVGQSDDGEGDGDARLVKIPAQDWPVGSMRPIIDYGNFPRYVGSERGVDFYKAGGKLPYPTKNVIGHIAQVNHTYGYIEADYAISNEMGLAFGESTTSARTFALNKAQGGPSLLSMYELSRLAAERCSSSRCAVQLMGDMAVEHGFYGDPEASTGGESILVADSDEQWIFHVLAESAKDGSAIWAGQRIPRKHVTIVSNGFVIGNINASDTGHNGNFLYSNNMHPVAKAQGWWDGQEPLHWTQTFSGGEYTSRYYAGRRMWGFWNVLAPSLKVPASYHSYRKAVGSTYPVSAAPDHPVVPSDVLNKVYRDYYRGTPYDLSVGPAAGPYGTPLRYKPGPAEAALNNCTDQCSHWERPIASFRTTSIHQVNIRPALNLDKRSVVWFLPGAALSGVFTPTYTSQSRVGPALSGGLNMKLDRTKAYWAFREMAQFMYPRWDHVKEIINLKQTALEDSAHKLITTLDKNSKTAEELIEENLMLQAGVVEEWQELYGDLLVRFSDGWDYTTSTAKVPVGDAKALGYPKWWLQEVKYTGGTPACYPTCD